MEKRYLSAIIINDVSANLVYWGGIDGFSVDVKQQELIALAKTIAEKEIAPRALRIDKSGVMDEELLEILKESGMTQLSVPKEYGGAGIDLLTGALISEQLSKGCAGVATICAANSLASFPILFAGSDMQKRDLFDCLNRGGMACFALTEPGAGSDAGAVSCRAEKVEGGYILNGTKCFITNAPIADKITLLPIQEKEAESEVLLYFL